MGEFVFLTTEWQWHRKNNQVGAAQSPKLAAALLQPAAQTYPEASCSQAEHTGVGAEPVKRRPTQTSESGALCLFFTSYFSKIQQSQLAAFGQDCLRACYRHVGS